MPPAIIPEKAIILHTLEDVGIYIIIYHTVCMYIIYTYKLHECPKSFNSMNHNLYNFQSLRNMIRKKNRN